MKYIIYFFLFIVMACGKGANQNGNSLTASKPEIIQFVGTFFEVGSKFKVIGKNFFPPIEIYLENKKCEKSELESQTTAFCTVPSDLAVGLEERAKEFSLVMNSKGMSSNSLKVRVTRGKPLFSLISLKKELDGSAVLNKTQVWAHSVPKLYIRGESFRKGIEVTLGDRTYTPEVISSSLLELNLTPPISPGTYNLKLENNDGGVFEQQIKILEPS